MNNHIILNNYGDDDVCSFTSGMFKIGKIKEVMKGAFGGSLQTPLNDFLKSRSLEINTNCYDHKTRINWQKQWFGDGIDCEVLQIGAKGWQKGKIKITVNVEFCPDEPEISEPETRFDDVR
jgi:hypothetical protein